MLGSGERVTYHELGATENRQDVNSAFKHYLNNGMQPIITRVELTPSLITPGAVCDDVVRHKFTRSVLNLEDHMIDGLATIETLKHDPLYESVRSKFIEIQSKTTEIKALLEQREEIPTEQIVELLRIYERATGNNPLPGLLLDSEKN